jgi:transposase
MELHFVRKTMPRGKDLSTDMFVMVVKLYSQGKSLRKIGQIIGKPHSTIQKIVDKYKYEGTVRNLSGRGGKKVLTPQNERMIVNKIRNDPKLSVPKMHSEVESVAGKSISQETNRNVLRWYDYHGRMARKKPFTSVVNRQKRLEFAKMHLKKPKEFWYDIIWSDQSKFNIFGSDGRQMVWRKMNTELQKDNLVPTVKHGEGSQMV